MLRSSSVNSSSYFTDYGSSTANNTASNTANNTARSYERKHVSAVDAAKSIALRTLKMLNKSSVAALQLDEVPSELLFGETVDLHRWTMILKDRNLEELSKQQYSGKQYFLDTSASKISNMFDTFYQATRVRDGLLHINISNAKDITNYGITMIARNNPNLLSIDISGCSQITDIALREVGMNCIKLENLNISSCLEIDGSGLGAIAETCRLLIKLNISKCRNIQNWSMKKIFYECKQLEDVNVSYLNKIGDEEIRVLSQNCPHLLTLSASECSYISDTSIQILASNCIDIDYIDISRSDMQYRISDISMLALGQKSHSLRTLLVNGCDCITDVGLNWLTEGCKAIEEIDLSNCNKITDAGMRSIGSNCHSLLKISLAHAKGVTDVGLASLTAGCPALRHVNLHGVFMLSDPRLSAPKKGAKLEAWQAVIGIAALAEHCSYIETLDLSGCFRLNIALHSYVSQFQYIQKLNLSGCNQCSSDALCEIAKKCNQLLELNLADCGKNVNNKVIQTFSLLCNQIKILILSRCVNITGNSIKSIAYNLHHLEKLDLNNCKYLNDHMLIYITEVDRIIKLKYLNISNINNITDSLLAWLSIKIHDIILLNITNTNITKKGIYSVKDRYPNSEIIINNNFYGFYPKKRVDDHILINKYYNFIYNIIKIQSKIRKIIAIKRVQKITIEWKKIQSQLLLQKVMRGYLTRIRTNIIKKYKQKCHYSAILITSFFRIPIAKNILKKKKLFLFNQYKNNIICKIQLLWRKYRDYHILLKKKREYTIYLKKKLDNIIKIQSIGRMYIAKIFIIKIKIMKKKKELILNKKAIIIQQNYRGYKARSITNQYKLLFLNLIEKRKNAVILIQQKYRCRRMNYIINTKIQKKKDILNAIILIQSLLRGSLTRIYITERKLELFEVKRNHAAILIQTHIRMIFAYIERMKRFNNNKRKNIIEYNASIKINNQIRIKLAYIHYKKKLKEYHMNMKNIILNEINAIIKIQSFIRGIYGRKIFLLKLKERKGKWKELFDENIQKRFFYNKLTGEIRWRMPQDLLDLIPKPICDNCNKTHAILECSICNELYCTICYQSVHSGGRRKNHLFRSLYDYYNKRIDYGDGEYPCKWPTEVIQDEVQGWMLNIAPKRQPMKIYNKSNWEVYEEGLLEKSNKIGSLKPLGNGGKLFYFNRNTFEATYDIPIEVIKEQDEIDLFEQQQQQQLLYTTTEPQQQQQVSLIAETNGYYNEYNQWIDTSNAYGYGEYDYYNSGSNSIDNSSMFYQQASAEENNSEYNYNYAENYQDGSVYTAADTGEYNGYEYPSSSGNEYGSNYEYPSSSGYQTPQKQIGYDENYDSNYYDYEAPPAEQGLLTRNNTGTVAAGGDTTTGTPVQKQEEEGDDHSSVSSNSSESLI